MKNLIYIFVLTILSMPCKAQQISLDRINRMPDKPAPYSMRDWKQVAKDYDNFIFDMNKTGQYLPLSTISSSNGVNYPDVRRIMMATYVGQNSSTTAEAINIMPAVVGASLIGIDKTNQFGNNWVTKLKDFFNSKNGQNVYLNNYSAGTGGDWWYEIMPSVFFYQLYALYPNIDADFNSQFTTIADRELNVLYALGGKLDPRQAPNMNYRAFNLITNTPNATSVPEPEAAGSIAWLLYQAYKQTNDMKYLEGAELGLDFLQQWGSNPSYEIQLPYGILTAARMNAEEGANYDINKFMNWTFCAGPGTLRGWGCIVGNWNGYDVSGLIGEANDAGNDYAFSMNGFQHAAALAPVAKYDKRYAKMIGKWILNLANASRLFYPDALPQANQEAASYTWSKQYDTNACIPFESMKQNWNGQKPYAMGDAVKGGWAPTNLSLYSGSSVGYMAAIINTTNVEGILQIDLDKTDFRGENTCPNYLYYNPNATDATVSISLPSGNYDIYDAITESVIKTNAAGSIPFQMPANDVRLLVIYPTGSTTKTEGRMLKTDNGDVIDYHYHYDYSNELATKAISFNDHLQIYPNPFSDSFQIATSNNENIKTIEIFAINGQLVWKKNDVAVNTDINPPVGKGIYIAKVITDSGVAHYTKLIKN